VQADQPRRRADAGSFLDVDLAIIQVAADIAEQLDGKGPAKDFIETLHAAG